MKKAFSLLLIGCFLVLGLGVVRVNAADVTDILNRELTEVTGTSYTEWSGKTSNSGAVYAGNSAGGNDSIQLRSNNNNSGIVSTTSAGKVKIITVEWNSNTASGRTLNVYGKNSAYSAATDLYNTSNQGTLLGTIVCGTSTELTITGNYTFFGVRSASGAMYLDELSVIWEVEGGNPDTDPVAVTGVSLNKSSLELEVGDSETLTATVSPNDASNKNVTWSSSDETIATVSNGTVTAVSAGNATITVTTEDGSHTASCNVTVTEPTPVLIVGKYYALQNYDGDEELTGVTTIGTNGTPNDIASYPLLIESGSSANTFSFKNDNNYLSWNSGNSLNVSQTKDANSSWKVTENQGKFSIANVADNNRKIRYNNSSPRFACYTSAQTDVKLVLLYSVSFNSNGGSSVDSINYIYSSKSIDKPADPTKNDYIFSGWYKDSELQDEWNFNTDTVTEDITLYAKWESAAQAIHVESVSLNKSSTSIEVGETETLIASISPDNAANKNVTWSSSDETIATVSNGVVTGVKAGTATITATSADNNEITDTCLVTVTAIPTYIISVEGGKFDNDETIAEFERGDTVSVSPVENNYEIFIYWSDSDSNVLSYDKYYTFTVNSDLEVFANFKSKDTFIDLTNSTSSTNGTFVQTLNSFSNCSYIKSISCSYAYENANYGAKFGSGSKKGSITITLKDGITATGIRIKAKNYGSDITKLYINSDDNTEQTLESTTTIYDFNFDETNKINIAPKNASNQRFYVYTIEILGISTYSNIYIQGSVGLDANDQGAFRLLGTVNEEFDSYGVEYKNSTGIWHESSGTPYDSVYAYDGVEKVSYTAESLGASIIFGVEVIGLPKGEYTISIRSFVEKESVKYYSAERTFIVTVSDSGVAVVEA